jgi:hypothetical protein
MKELLFCQMYFTRVNTYTNNKRSNEINQVVWRAELESWLVVKSLQYHTEFPMAKCHCQELLALSPRESLELVWAEGGGGGGRG